MHIIDIIVFLLFTGGVVAFGCSFFKKKGTSEEFTSAGRRLARLGGGDVHLCHVCQQYQLFGISGKGFFGRLECVCIQPVYPYSFLFCGSLLRALFTEARTVYRLIVSWKTASALGPVYIPRPVICLPRLHVQALFCICWHCP